MGGSLTFEDKNDVFVLSRLYAKGDPKKGVLTVNLNDEVVPESVFLIEFKILMVVFTLIALFSTKI